MSLSKHGSSVSQTPRGNSLNPNAEEFIPFSLRASSSSGKKQVLDASISSTSDEEWKHQLPDDITPDFKDQSLAVSALPIAALSLHPITETDRVSPATTTAPFFNQASCIWRNSNSSDAPPHHHFENDRDGTYFDGSTRHHYPTDVGAEDAATESSDSNPLHFLASQFPGFAAESLAEVYFANSCDLNLTFEMLTQLELQVDGAFDPNMNSKMLSSPDLTSMDFPALPVPDNKTNLPGGDLEQSADPYRSSEKDTMFLFQNGSSKSASDFASAVRKLASQNSGLWKYDRKGSGDAIVGSSKSSHVLSSSYDIGTGRSAYIDRMQSRSSSRAAPVWLETGDAVANLYSELREDARDHARIRNTYFEQARQAYLMGNKALAKELSVKGQMHNMQMKAAHNKAQESIYRQRNPISQERSLEKMIDLHGLHVSEAIPVLRQELGMLRNAARLREQRLHVYICVGTGHHTRGSRTPARLPISVQRYLLEEEGLDYTEPQPGLLRVVLY